MSRLLPLRASVALAAVASLSLPSRAAGTAIEIARQWYGSCHWSHAIDAFCKLDDADDPEAVRTSTQMLRYGRSLYGQDFSVQVVRVQQWQRAVRRAPTISHRNTPPAWRTRR